MFKDSWIKRNLSCNTGICLVLQYNILKKNSGLSIQVISKDFVLEKVDHLMQHLHVGADIFLGPSVPAMVTVLP